MEELGRFALRREIGAGSQSTVYEADDGGERCALRVFDQDAVPEGPSGRAALVEALKGLTRLEHPCIVRVLEAGEADDRLYAAMELMSCPTLAQKLQEGPLEEKQAALFIRQAAQALDKARDMGYSHGDLCAANVFVVSPEKVKLSDFAIKDILSDPAALQDASAVSPVGEELVTAEDLLRARGRTAGAGKLAADFTALAVLMMRMLGGQPEERQAAEPLGDYRQRVLSGSLGALGAPERGLSEHTLEIMRRLLTPGGFEGPGEVVVELASAMLLRRSFGPAAPQPGRSPTRSAQPSSPAQAPTAAAGPVAVQKDSDVISDWLTQPEHDVQVPETSRAAPEGLFAHFFVWHSRHGGIFFVVHDGEELSIGRDPDYADVALMDPAISRKHCIISKKGAVIRLEDPGSTNGTFVNGHRIESAELRPGDSLRIGATRVYMTLSAQDE
jgi:serine/threonine protein kinase